MYILIRKERGAPKRFVLMKNNSETNQKLIKIKQSTVRIFPHLFTEIACVIIIVSTLIIAACLTSTATTGQEIELMNPSTEPSIGSTEATENIVPTNPAVPTEPTEDDPVASAPQIDFEVDATEGPTTTTQIIEYQTSQMCFIGDGRVLSMQDSVITDTYFITKSSANLTWFNDAASIEFQQIAEKVGLCVVSLGINDIEHVDAYIDILNKFAEQYPDKVFVYVNLGPVNEELCAGLTNVSLEEFNDKMLQGLSDRWQIVDQYTYLATEGFSTNDGLYYSHQDSAKIFVWIVNAVKNQTITVVSKN